MDELRSLVSTALAELVNAHVPCRSSSSQSAPAFVPARTPALRAPPRPRCGCWPGACSTSTAHTAATLLVTVGDRPERLSSEASFARLCDVAPVPAGSGKTDGSRCLHRGGDRQADSAPWTIVLSRMATHPDTKAYVERRTEEGKQTRFIMRCLKHHLAREIFKLLPRRDLASTT